MGCMTVIRKEKRRKEGMTWIKMDSFPTPRVSRSWLVDVYAVMNTSHSILRHGWKRLSGFGSWSVRAPLGDGRGLVEYPWGSYGCSKHGKNELGSTDVYTQEAIMEVIDHVVEQDPDPDDASDVLSTKENKDACPEHGAECLQVHSSCSMKPESQSDG